MTEPPALLQEFGGSSEWPDFNRALLNTTIATVPGGTDEKDIDRQFASAMAGLAAFKPTTEVEAMLAAQCVGLHHAAMECLRRAMIPGQSFEVASRLRKDGANMARAMTDMLDALARYRGKCQTIRIEKIEVSDGGQAAIIGNLGTVGGRVRGEG